MLLSDSGIFTNSERKPSQDSSNGLLKESSKKLSRELVEETLGYKPSTYVDIITVSRMLNVESNEVYKLYTRSYHSKKD